MGSNCWIALRIAQKKVKDLEGQVSTLKEDYMGLVEWLVENHPEVWEEYP